MTGGPTEVCRAARVFDGLSDRLALDRFVTVDGGVIRAVAAEPPRGTDVTDLGDVTLLPGMVDTHVHLTWDASAEP